MIPNLTAETGNRSKACILRGGTVALLLFGAGHLCGWAAWNMPVRFSDCSSFLSRPKECLASGEDWNDPQARERAEKRASLHARWSFIMLPALLLSGILFVPVYALALLVPPPQHGFLWHILAAGLYFTLGAIVACWRARRADAYKRESISGKNS